MNIGTSGTRHVLRPTNGQYVQSQAQMYHTRKSHKKSKAGCLICKSRRIKCDEIKPKCGPCRNRNLVCTYDPIHNVRNVQKIALWPGKKSLPVLTEASAFSSDRDLELLHYFYSVVGLRIMLYPNGSIPSKGISDIILHNAHTMHVTLALSALHRRIMCGKGEQSLEEMSHWTHALTQFRQILTQAWDNDADAILTTSMFLNLLSFSDTRSRDDPSITTETPNFAWLRIQTGIAELLVRVSMRGTSKLWMPFWKQAGPDMQWIYDERDGTEGIPTEYIDLFDITENSTCEVHPYLRPLRRICTILQIERKTENVMMLIQFVQGVTNRFIDLLDTLDPRAMIILSHWLACLTCVDLWWCINRSHNGCKSICAYIDLYHPDLNPFMELPASCSGYIFRSQSNTPERKLLTENEIEILLSP